MPREAELDWQTAMIQKFDNEDTITSTISDGGVIHNDNSVDYPYTHPVREGASTSFEQEQPDRNLSAHADRGRLETASRANSPS